MPGWDTFAVIIGALPERWSASCRVGLDPDRGISASPDFRDRGAETSGEVTTEAQVQVDALQPRQPG